MAHATLQDVTDSLGRPIVGAESTQVNGWLDKIERIIARLPGLPAAIIDGTPTATTVAMVEANAVIRKIKNPDGKVAEGIDDYNYRLNENARKGDLFLTEEEWALISPDLPATLGGAYSVPLGAPWGAP